MNKYLFVLLFLITGCASKKVLVVVSSESELLLKNGKKYSTGYYFNELMIPVMRLKKQGYEIVFADPLSSTPSMDARSLSSKYFTSEEEYTEAKKLHEKMDHLMKPRSLRSIVDNGLAQFDGLLIPGGHAPLIDLMTHPEMKEILEHFHEKNKPTALICHGPVVLAAATANPKEYKKALEKGDYNAAKKAAGKWPYRGYMMTIFSTLEEKVAEESLGGPLYFYPEEVLKVAGGQVKTGDKWQSHVVIDRELITGQNPASDEELTKIFISELEKR